MDAIEKLTVCATGSTCSSGKGAAASTTAKAIDASSSISMIRVASRKTLRSAVRIASDYANVISA